MAERVQRRKTPPPGGTDDPEFKPKATKRSDKPKADVDDLLDEIDEVLETNAEDFVRSYVQKGGE